MLVQQAAMALAVQPLEVCARFESLTSRNELPPPQPHRIGSRWHPRRSVDGWVMPHIGAGVGVLLGLVSAVADQSVSANS